MRVSFVIRVSYYVKINNSFYYMTVKTTVISYYNFLLFQIEPNYHRISCIENSGEVIFFILAVLMYIK